MHQCAFHVHAASCVMHTMHTNGHDPSTPSPSTSCHTSSACSAAPTDEKGKFDEVVEEQGVRILIEPAALMHVIGTTMDFVEDRIK